MGTTTAFVNENFAVSGVVAANFYQHTTAPYFRTGSLAFDSENKEWVYVYAPSAVSAGVCAITAPSAPGAFTSVSDTQALKLPPKEAAAYWTIGAGTGVTAPVAFAAGEFGWVRKTANSI